MTVWIVTLSRYGDLVSKEAYNRRPTLGWIRAAFEAEFGMWHASFDEDSWDHDGNTYHQFFLGEQTITVEGLVMKALPSPVVAV